VRREPQELKHEAMIHGVDGDLTIELYHRQRTRDNSVRGCVHERLRCNEDIHFDCALSRRKISICVYSITWIRNINTACAKAATSNNAVTSTGWRPILTIHRCRRTFGQ